jgi:hypothetical protein
MQHLPGRSRGTQLGGEPKTFLNSVLPGFDSHAQSSAYAKKESDINVDRPSGILTMTNG